MMVDRPIPMDAPQDTDVLLSGGGPGGTAAATARTRAT